jgi:hypothetical protein
MFGIGLILGYLAGRPRKHKHELISEDTPMLDQRNKFQEGDDWIDPNEDYIN